MNRMQLTHEEAMKHIGKIIGACLKFYSEEISFDQLWYRVRGYKNNYAIQQFREPELSYLLLQLHMDFECWRGDRNDLIVQSAYQVAEWILKKTGGEA